MRNTILTIIGVMVLIGAISNMPGGGSKHKGSPAVLAGGSASPAATAARTSAGTGTSSSVPLTQTQRRFARAARARFAAASGASDAQLAGLASATCNARRAGASQGRLVSVARKRFSASAAPALVRLAEKDLCSGYLPQPPRVLATFSGSGIETTARFTVGGSGDWMLRWSYDCSGSGGSGNFIVDEDGGSDFSGASVNELGPGGHGGTHVYGDAGSHYLSIDSECSWTVTAVTSS